MGVMAVGVLAVVGVLGYGGAERVGVFCGKMRGGRLLRVMAVGVLAVVGVRGYGGGRAETGQVC